MDIRADPPTRVQILELRTTEEDKYISTSALNILSPHHKCPNAANSIPSPSPPLPLPLPHAHYPQPAPSPNARTSVLYVQRQSLPPTSQPTSSTNARNSYPQRHPHTNRPPPHHPSQHKNPNDPPRWRHCRRLWWTGNDRRGVRYPVFSPVFVIIDKNDDCWNAAGGTQTQRRETWLSGVRVGVSWK